MSRINTNIPSMIAARLLNLQRQALNESLTRLSTGLRINSGGDDPAGLIASEMLRGEKVAIGAAIANGERATHVIATAEGSLNEVASLMTELEELVTSAANEGAMDSDEVAAKQLEVDNILTSINRIASSAEFMGKNLLDGTLDYTTSGTNLSAFDDLTIRSAKLADGSSLQVAMQITDSAEYASTGSAAGIGATATTLQVTGTYGTETFTFAASSTAANVAAAIKASKEFTGVSAYLSANISGDNNVYMTSTTYGTDAFVTVSVVEGAYNSTGTFYGEDIDVKINGETVTGTGLKVSINTGTLSLEGYVDSSASGTKTFYVTGGGANFALAPDVLTGRTSIGIPSVTTGNLGDATLGYLGSLGTGKTNSLSSNNLATAQRIVKSAIKELAMLRGRLGSFQSLVVDSSVRSLGITQENVAAAESAIRDTDFATETANMTRAQILVQAATSVLYQTNLAPQTVLALLS